MSYINTTTMLQNYILMCEDLKVSSSLEDFYNMTKSEEHLIMFSLYCAVQGYSVESLNNWMIDITQGSFEDYIEELKESWKQLTRGDLTWVHH